MNHCPNPNYVKLTSKKKNPKKKPKKKILNIGDACIYYEHKYMCRCFEWHEKIALFLKTKVMMLRSQHASQYLHTYVFYISPL